MGFERFAFVPDLSKRLSRPRNVDWHGADDLSKYLLLAEVLFDLIENNPYVFLGSSE